MRKARRERRQREMAEQRAEADAVAAFEGDGGGAAALRANEAYPAQQVQFQLPPKAHWERQGSHFGTFVKLSLLLTVVLPTVLTILFFAFVASEQFATQSQFAVRGPTTSAPAPDFGSLLTGAPSATDVVASDSFILVDYIHSKEMVEILVAEANFLEVYSRESVDAYYRLDPQSSIEDLVDYWQLMSRVEYDVETGIISMVVRAFRPNDAEAITSKVIEKSEQLVNDLSVRSREDGVRAAEREVEIAEERFSTARQDVAAFRGTEREIDPTATATTQQTVVGVLQGELAEQEARLTRYRLTMPPTAPLVREAQSQIAALRAQIASERDSVAESDTLGRDQPALTERLSQYEELVAEREFAQQAYISALASLEAARVEALKQQRYLAVFVRGTAPESSTYPDAVRWTLILFGALFSIWGISILVAAALRDRFG